MLTLEETVRENLGSVNGEIADAAARCGRDPAGVTVMAVTKTHPADHILAAIRCGISHIGENRVTEGGRKIREVGPDAAVFHAIGVLHRSEVRQALRDFHCLDAVDRVAILEEIARRGAFPEILLEVNTSGEEAKKGFPPNTALLFEALGKARELGLQVKGFLTVGPLYGDEADKRKAFALLRELRDKLSSELDMELPELSMGMSDDFVPAVLEGSTMVRLGTRLFGPRGR